MITSKKALFYMALYTLGASQLLLSAPTESLNDAQSVRREHFADGLLKAQMGENGEASRAIAGPARRPKSGPVEPEGRAGGPQKALLRAPQTNDRGLTDMEKIGLRMQRFLKTVHNRITRQGGLTRQDKEDWARLAVGYRQWMAQTHPSGLVAPEVDEAVLQTFIRAMTDLSKMPLQPEEAS
ncbi:hypothetical protein PTTG_12155 [Puccinia triticina 1-1 BBBD Race 1]|uniref:RxLR effector protein n=1 Tax=Puccinia triticina (isolate 1-1 / race 1 (BBBD)) TaxID=630390 RepID=A0A180G5G4_PUCT1|nr:hypothetical protein PTTG_12155 [Puccinia triticina 1-1 BBBD Race 1]